MSNQYLLKESRTVIELAAKPFAGGGEGGLYKIVAPTAYQNYVAKLYHPHKRSQQREEKTQYLIENPPIGLSENDAIVWIKDALYTQSYQFVGFVMPFAKGQKLELLCLGKLPKHLGKQWQRFSFNAPDSLQYRLRICFNLAAAIYQMHATEHYVLVDMKPENILIQPNGLLAIVDTDSVEVVEEEVAIFPAPVATPEYTPPEFYSNAHRKNETVSESWDRFGLAVIFYKLLCGIHPFAASANPPYDHLVSLHEKIEHGLFVHRTINRAVFSVVPPPHQQFYTIDSNLQELFIQCFEEGHENPEARPTADEWCSAFLIAIGDPKLEAHFAHILGLWGNVSKLKMKLPSVLYQQYLEELHPKRWLEEQVSAVFGSLPPLPITLHQAIESGKQQIQLALTFKDYVLSFIVLGILLFIIGSCTPLGGWMMGDFWLLPIWLINLVIIGLMLSLWSVFPRVVSWTRHIASPEVKARKLWKRFRLTYPQLKRDVIETKRVVLEKLLVKNKVQIAAIEKEKIQYEAPLKKYLQEQDTKVKTLMGERKVALEAISKKYLEQTVHNQLLVAMNGRYIFALHKRLKSFYQNSLKLLGQKEKKVLEEAYRKAKTKLKEEIDIGQQALMDEAMSIFDLNYFYDKHFNADKLEKASLKKLIEKYPIKNLRDIQTMSQGGNGDLTIILCKESPNYEKGVDEIYLSVKSHQYLEKLYAAYLKYQEGIVYAQTHDINYGKAYFQERYAHKREQDEKLLEDLKDTYQKQLEELQQVDLPQKKQALKKDFEAANVLLEQLIEQEKVEIEKIEQTFKTQYELIYKESEATMSKMTQRLEDMNKDYRIEVQALLSSPSIENIQLNIQEKIQQAHKDIVALEGLKL
ncbi:hypothetical protein [Aureispira sp. CCB-QB1]|uniref:protein kinase domain-containing protein n=1 Tax=Aureispira sp. CCB-QB1 TaxID=1313421 RepID=UPI00069848FC|nr:hypothetical protein [Aureispira sp. CCB-QB1]